MEDQISSRLGAFGVIALIGIAALILGVWGIWPTNGIELPIAVRLLAVIFGVIFAAIGIFYFLIWSTRGKKKRLAFESSWRNGFVGIALIAIFLGSGFVVFDERKQEDSTQANANVQSDTTIDTIEIAVPSQPVSPTLAPTPIFSEVEKIHHTVLLYFDNIPNDRISNDEINIDLAFNILHSSLRDEFGEQGWRQFVNASMHVIDTSFLDMIEIATYYAKADIDIEVINNIESWSSEQATICLVKEGGIWFITHIHKAQFDLEFCKE